LIARINKMNSPSDSKPSLNRTKFQNVLSNGSFVLVLVQTIAICILVFLLATAPSNEHHDPRNAAVSSSFIVSVVRLIGVVSLYIILVTLLVTGIFAASFSKNWIALGIQLLLLIALIVIYGLSLNSMAAAKQDKIRPEGYPNLAERNLREYHVPRTFQHDLLNPQPSCALGCSCHQVENQRNWIISFRFNPIHDSKF